MSHHDSAMLHDERTYRDPHTFDPARFLPRRPGAGDGGVSQPELDPRSIVFGFGRR